MTQFLPPNLLALFAPREPIPYLPPVDKLSYEKKNAGCYTGIASFISRFENPKDTPPAKKIENREERQERKRKEKAEQVAYKLEQDIALWAPHNNASATTDPYRTLFVARVNYDTSEAKLLREFELYGPIKKISIIQNALSGNPRGYAFIEYERELDMHSAYKHADGKKIDGRRVLVDVERGRTVKGWLPRRLGGGLGGTRRGGPEVNIKHSGRVEPRPEDRYVDRERERPERERLERERPERERPERRRTRSRSRDRRRRASRSRSKDRDRHRVERRKRDRSRDRGDRDRRWDRDGGSGADKNSTGVELNDVAEESRKERRRSRSRDRDRRRRRSRSKDRDRKRRDYDRDRESRRDRGADHDERTHEEPSSFPEQNQENFSNNSGFDAGYSSFTNNDNNESGNFDGY